MCRVCTFLNYISCSNGLLGSIPTIIFTFSIGVILCKESPIQTAETWADTILQELLLIGSIILTVRSWLVITKAARWMLELSMKFVKAGYDNQNVNSLLVFFWEHEEFLHLTICWALSMVPATYAFDTPLSRVYLKHIQPKIPPQLLDMSVLKSITATSVALNFAEACIRCTSGDCHPMMRAIYNLYVEYCNE